MTPDSQVPSGNQPGVAAQSATPQSGQVAGNSATPTSPQADADALKAQFEAQRVQLERDIAAIKSASQRREYELTQRLEQQQRTFQEQLRQTQMEGMDEDQRKAYQQQIAMDEASELQERLQEMRQQNEEVQGKMNAFQYFRSNGVPVEKLSLEGTLQDLVQSGYGWLTERNKELERLVAEKAQAPNAPQKPAAPEPLPNAPQVDTAKGATPGAGPSWADIDKEYADKGGRERFYQDLQSGAIPASRLPVRPEA